jgi:hypothetical protein
MVDVGEGSMSTADVQAANQQTADRLIEEARRNPGSPLMGKFVGIANGQVVVVADDWDELARQLSEIVRDPSITLSLEVGVDYDQVQEIWGLR